MRTIYILLASEPIGERIFIGLLTGIIFSVIYFFYEKNKNKKVSKECDEKVKKEILSDSKGTLAIVNPLIPVNCYTSLYEELKEKCNPANFMNPYDAEKVEISNNIFSRLDSNATNIQALIQLRNLAINKLGLSFSAKEIYEKLAEAYNPQKFVGKNYDADKLHIANQVYSRIQSNQNSIIELEKIAQEYGIDFVKSDITNDANTANCNKETIRNNLDNSNTDSNVGFITTIVLTFISICFIVFIVAETSDAQNDAKSVAAADTVQNDTLPIVYADKEKKKSVEKRDEDGNLRSEQEIEIKDFINYNTTYVIPEITIADMSFTPAKRYHYRNGEVKFSKSKIIINIGGNNFVSRIVSSRFYRKEYDNFSSDEAEFVTENGEFHFWKDSRCHYNLSGNFDNY